MPLAARPIHIPAGLAFDESLRLELSDVGQLNRSNVNVRMWEMGALGKRLGYSALASTRLDGTTRSAGYRMFSAGSQLCVIDGTTLDTWSDLLGRWVSHGRVPEATYRRTQAPTVGGSSAEDCVAVNGFSVVVSLAADTTNFYLYASVVDASTGNIVRGPDKLDSAVQPVGLNGTQVRVASYGNVAIAFFADVVAGNIRTKYLDLTSATSIAAGWQTLTTVSGYTTTGSNGAFDVANVLSNDRVALAFVNSGGAASRITVTTLNIAGAIGSVNVSTSSVVPIVGCIGIAENGDTLWLAWKDQTNNAVKAIGLNATALTISSSVATVINSSFTQGFVHVEPRVGTKLAVVYATGLLNAAGNFGILIQAIKDNGSGGVTTDGNLNTVGGVQLASRPFLRNGRLYAHANGLAGGDYTLCDVTPDIVSASPILYLRPVCAPVIRGLALTSAQRRGRAATLSSTTYAYAGQELAENNSTTTDLLVYDFADPQRWHTARLGELTYIGGGVLSVFDGLRVFESSFLCVPSKPTTTNTTGTGLSLTNGRVYVAVYEEVDAAGNIHVSGTSVPSVISGPQTNKAVVISVSPLAITARGNASGAASHSLRVALYATADAAIGAAPYYRVGTIENEPNNAILTFSDTMSEAILATQALLYDTGNLPGTNGASQDHRAPPGLVWIVNYNEMLVGCSDSTIYSSSQPVSGEGAWFSPIFTQPIGEESTGIFVQDGTCFPTTRAGLWSVAGDPPSDNGTVGGLGTPRRLAVDRGCVNANSIVTTEAGTFFVSDLGLELFNRSQSTTFIGKSVQTTFGTWPSVTSATLDTQRGLVRFSLAASVTAGVVASDGVDVVFDIARAGGWISRDSKHGSINEQASQDACIAFVGGVWRYCWLAPDGTVYVEHLLSDSDKCLDVGTFVTAQYELPPMKMGLQQEQVVYEMMILFAHKSAAGLIIECATDYGAYGAVSPDKPWSEAETLGQRQLEFRPKYRNEGIQLRVRDTAPAVLGTGEGLAFIGISADVASTQVGTRATPRLATGGRK